MKTANGIQLAAWIAREHPGLFKVLAWQAAGGMAGLGDDSIATVDPSTLAVPDVSSIAITPSVDLSTATDSGGILSSIGSGISSAASGVSGAIGSVGSWLTSSQGLTTLANLGASYFKAQTSVAQANQAQAVLGTQIARAQAGQPVAPITYANGQAVYVPTATGTGLTTIPAGLGSAVGAGYAVTPAALSNLAPTFLQKYGTYMLIGGALLLVGLIIRRRA